jgi:predicted ATPase
MRRIYGRDAEIAALVEAWDRAASGRLAVVLIEAAQRPTVTAS